MKDYEQLYYDLLYENKKLKEKIRELEDDLNISNNQVKKKNVLLLKKELIKEIEMYFKKNGDDEINE